MKWLSKIIGKMILLAQDIHPEPAFNLYYLEDLPKTSEERQAYAGWVKLKHCPYLLFVSPEGTVSANGYIIEHNGETTWKEAFENAVKAGLSQREGMLHRLSKRRFKQKIMRMEAMTNLLLNIPHIAKAIKALDQNSSRQPTDAISLSRDDMHRWLSECELLLQGWKINNFEVTRNNDRFTLDSLSLTPPNNDSSQSMNNGSSYLLYFNGNNENITDSIPEFIEIAQATHHTMVGFNYHGVGYSNQKMLKKDYVESFNDLVEDGIAEVQYLLNQGIPPHRITLFGHSLGGAVAVHVAAYFHQQGVKIFIINSRSFSKLSSVIINTLDPLFLNKKETQPIGPQLPKERKKEEKPHHSLLSRFIAWIAKSFGWETDVISAWKTIDKNYKVYFYAKGDPIIHRDASLHKAIKLLTKEKRSEAEIINADNSEGEKFIVSTQSTDAHNAMLTELIHPKKLKNALDWMNEWLQKKAAMAEEGLTQGSNEHRLFKSSPVAGLEPLVSISAYSNSRYPQKLSRQGNAANGFSQTGCQGKHP